MWKYDPELAPYDIIFICVKHFQIVKASSILFDTFVPLIIPQDLGFEVFVKFLHANVQRNKWLLVFAVRLYLKRGPVDF